MEESVTLTATFQIPLHQVIGQGTMSLSVLIETVLIEKRPHNPRFKPTVLRSLRSFRTAA